MDLIFLDIELIERNGVEVGNFIRNELNDEKHILSISHQNNTMP